MRRKIIVFFIIFICFILQTTVFQTLSVAGVAPNLLIVIISSFGFMRGKREGMLIGFFCGLIVDIFFGFTLGVYALLYMYIGFLNGLFQKHFYPDDIKLPILLISASDIAANLVIYFLLFLLRGKFQIWYYLKAVFFPELIYTIVVAILLYVLLLKINQGLEKREKRSAKKFDL